MISVVSTGVGKDFSGSNVSISVSLSDLAYAVSSLSCWYERSAWILWSSHLKVSKIHHSQLQFGPWTCHKLYTYLIMDCVCVYCSDSRCCEREREISQTQTGMIMQTYAQNPSHKTQRINTDMLDHASPYNKEYHCNCTAKNNVHDITMQSVFPTEILLSAHKVWL